MWVPYLRDTEDEEKIEAYIKKLEEENGFTDFYFVSREGEYRTADGKTGYLDLKQSLPALILHGRDAVVNSVVPGQPQIMVFASPTAPPERTKALPMRPLPSASTTPIL